MKSRWFNLDTFVAILFIASFLAVIASNWYHFYLVKDFNYLVEAPCDPANSLCFVRDCENDPDSCPPNNLSYYTSYYVKAYDFRTCADNTCDLECRTGAISCAEIPCGESEEDLCEGPLTEDAPSVDVY